MTTPTLALRIRTARESAHLTQQQLAQRAGLCIGTVYRIERGHDARSSTVERIERAIEEAKAKGSVKT